MPDPNEGQQAETILDEQGNPEQPPPPPVEPPPVPDPPPPPVTPRQQFDQAVSGVRDALGAVGAADASVEESDNAIEGLQTELDTALVAHTGRVTSQETAVSGYNDSLDGLIAVLNALRR